MQFNKITHGVVIQTFNDVGEFVGQEFIAGDITEYETVDGDKINMMNMPLGGKEYQSFDMIPNTRIRNASEQIQEDLSSILDRFPDTIVSAACQSVVDNLKSLY